MKFRMRAVAAAIALIGTSAAWAGEPEAQKWIDSEFQPSTLSKDQQLAEMKWFIEAAAKLKAQGVNEINVVSRPSPPTSTSPRPWPRPSARSPVSRSLTT